MNSLKEINWNQVYCFYEVARKLSMKEAAKILGVATPTVSEQIKRLESVCYTQLFRRLPRRIELTDEGSRLYWIAKEMFEVGGKFLDTVSSDLVGGYPVWVGVQESLLDSVASEFLNQYWDLFAPFGTVNTKRVSHYENLIDQTVRGQVDFALGCHVPKTTRLQYREVGQIDMVFCCARELCKRFANKKEILRCIPLARSTWDSHLNEMVDDNLRQLEIHPDEFVESDHQDFVLELVLRGRCVGVFPRSLIADAKFSGIEVIEVTEAMSINLYAIWNRGSERMIAIKKLIELFDMKKPPAVMADPEFQLKLGHYKPESFDMDS